jgi:hypothetical protein
VVRRLRAAGGLSGADEVFRTPRAWRFAMVFGALTETSPEGFSPRLLANIDEGRALTGADIARAEAEHTALYHRVREFFADYQTAAGPGQPGRAVPGRAAVPDRGGRPVAVELPGLDGLGARRPPLP